MSAAQATFMPLVRHLDLIVAGWQRLIDRVTDSYRPERHYMRGPGPKCRAKRAGLMAQTAAATAGTGADFAKLHA